MYSVAHFLKLFLEEYALKISFRSELHLYNFEKD